MAIRHLYLSKQTFATLSNSASDYLRNNTDATLTSFLNDLPTLPNQDFFINSFIHPPIYTPQAKRYIPLSTQSVSAYLSLSSQFNFSPSNSTEYTVSQFLTIMAAGHITPTQIPTNFSPSTPTKYTFISVSDEALANLFLLSTPYSPSNHPSIEGISDYLFLLSAYNLQFYDSKPETYTIQSKSLDFTLSLPATLESTHRSAKIALKLPLSFLLNLANQFQIRGLRQQSDNAIAASVIEYIGLGWITPYDSIPLQTSPD